MRAITVAMSLCLLCACKRDPDLNDCSYKPGGCLRPDSVAVPPQPPKAQQEAPARAPAPPPPSTFKEATILAVPMMTDTVEKASPGTIALVRWLSDNGTFDELNVAKDESGYALIMKDPESERGKRLCVSGSLIQIEVARLAGGVKINAALLLADSGNIWSIAAARSSGTLVEGQRARVCGAVIGKFSYRNTRGGTGHAAQIVGMFDLPENRQK